MPPEDRATLLVSDFEQAQAVEPCDRECSSAFKLESDLLDDRRKSHFTHIARRFSRWAIRK
jgi:hypothetical protein